jgi:hypothetical protein
MPPRIKNQLRRFLIRGIRAEGARSNKYAEHKRFGGGLKAAHRAARLIYTERDQMVIYERNKAYFIVIC